MSSEKSQQIQHIFFSTIFVKLLGLLRFVFIVVIADVAAVSAVAVAVVVAVAVAVAVVVAVAIDVTVAVVGGLHSQIKEVFCGSMRANLICRCPGCWP